MGEKKKIFVGMSGGVDSSVSAALLKEAGHEVVGVFIKVWQADFLPCTWREERREAMRAAAHLGIPFLTLDLSAEYKKDVVDYMIREYGAGRVPNPDVMCNKYVKFGAFLDFARKHGADAIATGHYARIEANFGHLMSKNRMFAGVDTEKDQTYFLWTLTQDQLAHTLFPIGHLRKSDVRTLAKKFGLPNAEKKDSQGLCFMGKVDMAEFLRHFLKLEPGKVLDERGNAIGEHDGALIYTIGQRQGFRVAHRHPDDPPLYVVGKNAKENTITVAPNSEQFSVNGEQENTLRLESANIIGELQEDERLEVRTRYRGPLITAVLMGNRLTLIDSLEAVASGQSAVFYRGEECLGGGVIADSLDFHR